MRNDIGGFVMADNKQYITLPQENGSVMISEDVVAAIVSNAAKDVEGVAALCVKRNSDIVELISKKNWKRGLRISIEQNNKVVIECNLIINYGQSVVDVAKAVQEAVATAVTSVTGAKVVSVNVNICGIVRK